jgi:hypothetical protein
MKKQLLWCALVLLAGFTSCKKGDLKPVTDPAATAKTTKQKVNTVTAGYYVDLNLQARKPGENFDTYTAAFGATTVTVTGAPSWNTVLYPTLQNGVPTGISGAAGVSTTAINTWITTDVNSFVVTVGIMSYFDINKFRQNQSDYNSALNTFQSAYASGNTSGSLMPLIQNYISKDYSTQPGYQSTSAKLIRVTTGSHWAIATIDYPTPPIPSGGNLMTLYTIQDPLHPTGPYYYLNCANGFIYSTQIPGAKASGTYTTAGYHSTVYHFIGTITRADGSEFTFDVTDDIG